MPLGDGEKIRRDSELAKSDRVRISIPGEPQPKERPRFNRKTGHFYTPTKTREYESRVAAIASAARVRYTIHTPLSVTATLYTAKKKPADVDNCFKSLLDGLMKGGLIEDDSQVEEVVICRVRSGQPRADVVVVKTDISYELGEGDGEDV